MPDNLFRTSLQQRFYSITPQYLCKTKKSQKQQIAIKKNPACRILRLRRVALATLFHSAAVRSLAERFLCHRTKFPMTIRVSKDTLTFIDFCLYLENLTRIDFRIGYLKNLQNANLVFFILIMLSLFWRHNEPSYFHNPIAF